MESCNNWGFSMGVTRDGDQHPEQSHSAGLWVLRGLLLQVLVLVWFGGDKLPL